MDKNEFINLFNDIPEDSDIMIAINTGDAVYFQSDFEVKYLDEDKTVYIIHDL